MIILDTGPLVALLNRRDRYHAWAAEQWSRITPPLLTCEAVLAETCHLIQPFRGNQAAVLDLVHCGVVSIEFRLASEMKAVSRLLDKYRDVPMSLADGCLVRMAGLHNQSTILTLDSDFKLYRKNGRQTIPVLSPGA